MVFLPGIHYHQLLILYRQRHAILCQIIKYNFCPALFHADLRLCQMEPHHQLPRRIYFQHVHSHAFCTSCSKCSIMLCFPAAIFADSPFPYPSFLPAANPLPPRNLCPVSTPKGFARYAFCVTKCKPPAGLAFWSGVWLPETPNKIGYMPYYRENYIFSISNPAFPISFLYLFFSFYIFSISLKIPP